MIVEVLGPPGVGKTTFASALTDYLQLRGAKVDPVMSYRPAEVKSGSANGRHAFAPLRRLARPVVEMAKVTGDLLGHSDDTETTAALLRLLPTRSVMWSIRLRQYLIRLFHAWRIAETSSGVVVFDQAFVQGVCSLALLARSPSSERTRRALGLVPQADMFIALEAPREMLAHRLGERQRQQSRLEQMLELDLEMNLASIDIIDELRAMLRATGVSVVSARSVDRNQLDAEVAVVGEAVLARCRSQTGRHPHLARTITIPEWQMER